MLATMPVPVLADSHVFARLPASVQDAVLVCAVVLERLDDADQRLAVAVLMSAAKLGELKPAGKAGRKLN
jgi:hypothetical protein